MRVQSWMTRACVIVVMVLTLGTATIAAAASVPVVPGQAKSSSFASAKGCGCHANLVDEWSASMHAQALSDPLYLAKVDEGNKATGGALGAFCNKCHGPVATMGNEFKGKMSAVGKEAITCSFCHQVTGLMAGEPGNTSQLVATDGVRRAQIKDPAAPHKAAYSAFHKTAEFCGGCHNVNHPVNGMHLESTYSEWKASAYARRGVTCQDCHMSRAPGAVGPYEGQAAGGAKYRDDIYAMSFIGANSTLGPSGPAKELLRSAVELSMEAPTIADDGSVELTVTIKNVGAGHDLPTGLTEFREMWLDVYATGTDGKKTSIGQTRYGTELKDAKGKFPVQIWEATGVESDKRIPAMGEDVESFTFKMPSGAEKADITAALMYRSATEEFATKASTKVETVEVASAVKAVYASEDAHRKVTRPGQGKFVDGYNLWVMIIAMVVIVALIVYFARRGSRN